MNLICPNAGSKWWVYWSSREFPLIFKFYVSIKVKYEANCVLFPVLHNTFNLLWLLIILHIITMEYLQFYHHSHIQVFDHYDNLYFLFCFCHSWNVFIYFVFLGVVCGVVISILLFFGEDMSCNKPKKFPTGINTNFDSEILKALWPFSLV